METVEESGQEPLIADWRRRIQEQIDLGEKLLTEGSAQYWNAPPVRGDEWTAAQHMEHLCIVGEKMIEKIEAALAATPPKGDPNHWKPGWFGKVFIAACGPQPPGRSTPAPPLFVPGPGPFDITELRKRFLEVHSQFPILLDRCIEVDLARIKVPSAAMPLLRLDLGTWFEAMAVHIAYHVSCARTLLK